MNFKDIQPYIERNGYSVFHSLGRLKKTIDEYVEELGLELNPDFQRGHVWTEEQQIKYMEHVLREGRSGLEIYLNHPGWSRDYKGDFVCVDGLQRITACLRFLNDEIKVFGHYYSEFEDKIDHMIGLHFTINSLQTRKEVLQWYLETNDGGTVHSQSEIDRVRALWLAEKS